MSKNDPARLTEIRIEIQPLIEKRESELWESSIGGQYYFDIKGLQDELEAINEYRMSDYWYRPQGPSYWSGILYAWPWDNISHKYSEESIWKLILEYHAHVDVENWVVTFKFNPKSPINAWLRTWSTWERSGGNVVSNVQTVLRVALKFLIENEDSLWKWQEDEWDEELEEVENEV